jgi:hypothetical protein
MCFESDNKMLTYISRTVVIWNSLSVTEGHAQEDETEVREGDQEPIYVSVGLEDIVSLDIHQRILPSLLILQ